MKIRVLPDHVANQIAAGEVVERPAAVIKELLENSLDAGATRIEIEFRHGGKSYMRIEDNGIGMSSDQALLALERHATSKIRETKDLYAITTFGFRGEALPSIASVSRFILRTRTATEDQGTEILMNGGKFIHKREYGMPPGTLIEVGQLFNSVPVRRKFMKAEATEASHIVQLVRTFAIGHQNVQFTLIEEGRVIFKSPIERTLQERISCVWGAKLAEDLIPLESVNAGMRITGLIGKPGVSRSSRHEMLFFINGRPVESRALNYAVLESYHTHIPKGRYPVVVLFLEIAPQAVDVNVHPSKLEVRFREEALVRQFVIRALIQTLSGAEPTSVPVSEVVLPRPISSIQPQATAPGVAIERPKPAITPVITQVPVSRIVESLKPAVQPIVPKPQPVVPPKASSLESWRYIGFWGNDCALFESSAGLVIFNLQRAQERIRFEQIKAQLGSHQVASQSLLLSIPLELDPALSAALECSMTTFNQNGFTIEPFGRNFYKIEGIPSWLEPSHVETLLRDLLGSIHEKGQDWLQQDEFLDHFSQKAYVLSGKLSTQSLSEERIQHLYQQWLGCIHPLTCPRGHKTFFEVGQSEAAKHFGR